MDNGWIQNNLTRARLRVLKHAPWYAEFASESGHYLSPATLCFMFLKAHCDEFEIENTIDSFYWESTVCGNTNELSSKDNMWVDSGNINSLLTAHNTFVVKYKDLTISNRQGNRDHFDDFFVLLNLNHNNQGWVGGWRQNIPYVHYIQGYLHSHLSGYTYQNGFDVRNFCTGHSNTSINSTFSRLRQFFTVVNNAVVLSAPLLDYPVSPDFERVYEEFEKKILDFKSAWLPLIQHESLAGGPYKYIANNRESIPFAITEDVFFDQFAKLIAHNAEDARLKFNISAESVVVKDTPGLVEFAKENGFYEKCFAFDAGNGMYNASVAQQATNLDRNEFIKSSKLATLCRSPFKWNGERLSVILHPNSKSNTNARQARLNSAKRSYFNTQLTGYFRKGLLMSSL